jgi:indole-3-glycerol phosphate synthase
VKAALAEVPLAEMRARAEAGAASPPFERALAATGLSFICEVKKASPSRGVIAEDFPYLDIARDYEAAGAAAISVLTEPTRFLGSERHLEEIARGAGVPVLRKDFVVDAYQLYEARALGASAALLIVSLLGASELQEYIAVCDSVGLSALVEAHDGREIETALAAGARIVGVNNRDLRTFDVDPGRSAALRRLVPEGVIFVAESGIRTPEDAAAARAAGADAVLVGEALMRAPDRAAFLRELRGEKS